MTEKRVTVRLTLPQLNALDQTVRSELESLTSQDWASGGHDHLAEALDALRSARRLAAAKVQA